MKYVLPWIYVGLLAACLGCAGGQYRAPDGGPVAYLSIASTCVERAAFFAEINGSRTATSGCNETAEWVIPAGPLVLVVQVEQASYRVEPLETRLEVTPGSCLQFLLRQTQGFELVTLSADACE